MPAGDCEVHQPARHNPVAQIVLEIPDSCKQLGAVLPDVVARLVARHDQLVAAPGGDYIATETLFYEQSARIERAAHHDALSALDILDPWVLIGGAVHRLVGRHAETYYTQAGPILVERNIFRPADKADAPAVDPIAARIGVVGDGWLPGTAKIMAHALQQGTAREAAASARQHHRTPYCRNSFDAVGHAVGKLVRAERESVEATLIEGYVVPEGASAISVSIDRVSVPMEEPRDRKVGRPRKDAPKRLVQRVFRMAYCATITLHDNKGEALHTIRYGRMPRGDIAGLLDGLLDDVLALRKKRPSLDVILLCDGAAENWTLLSAHFTKEKLGTKPWMLVDLFHLLEKLGSAAKVKVKADKVGAGDATGKVVKTAVSTMVDRWKARLLNAPKAWEKIHAEIDAWGLEWQADGDDEPVHEALRYLKNQGEAGRLNFADARSKGLPVGSGNVEATCKSLFQIRMKRAGARWHEDTAEDIITLRALAISDRWDKALDLTLEMHQIEVKLAA